MNHTGKFTKTKYGKWRIYDLHVEHVYFPYTSSYGNILLNYQRVYLKMFRRVSLSRATYDTSNTPPNTFHTRLSLLVCASNDLMFSCSGKWCLYDLPIEHADFPYSYGNILLICQRVYPKKTTISTGEMTTLTGCMSFFLCQCRALHRTF